MVKYYGDSGGRKRGKYKSCKLGAWFSTEEFLEKWGNDPTLASPAKDMNAYLSRAGSFVAREATYRDDNYCSLNVYHYGGATVALKYRFHTDFSGKDVAGNLSVKMVSINFIDDVVERLQKRFPYLKENASIDDIPNPADDKEK